MAQLAIAAAGAAVGFVASGFNPIGAQAGWAIGSLVGSQFGPKQKSFGPRLEDLRVTGSEYGQTIPWAAGHPRIAGQVWWASQRREIGTTTSAGKGGGGAESTTYTYEVDILYGLVNRQITGVSRIWLNGKLIWTNHSDSDTDSLSNSQNDAPWDRITVYTGESTQLPDPTYEAAVTNAPAYRGRGTVFIEGLQLGNSGVIPNLTFEVVIDGTQVDALTLLQSYFDGNDSSDISANNRGTGTLFNSASLSGNDLVVNVNNSATPSTGGYIQYQPVGLEPNGNGPILFEFMATMSAVPNIAYTMMAEIVTNTSQISSTYHRFGYYGNAGLVVYDNSAFGQQYLSDAPVSGKVHYALQFTSSSARAYINGVKVWEATGDNTLSSTQMRVILGDRFGYTSGTTNFTVHEFAVRQKESYTGASFTPPITIDLPDGGAITPNDDTLQNVVEDLCEVAGMPAGTYDATALASITKPVRAFVLSQVATARSAIEQLMSAYFFEAYVSDKLYFVPRAGSVVDTIDADDMGAGIENPSDETLPTQVGNELEIPSQVSVSYSNADADYTTATEHSDRLV